MLRTLLTSRAKKTPLTLDKKETLCGEKITDKASFWKNWGTKFQCEKCFKSEN